MTARVSVVLPVKNGMPYLPAAVQSVLAQTYRDFELIVIDDGSTDGTIDFLGSLSDERVRVIAAATQGLAGALNSGLASARGEYLARHDADDRSAAGRFERQVALLDAHPEIAVVATCANYIDARDRSIDDEWTRIVRAQQDKAQSAEAIRLLMPLTCCITHGSVMMRTDVLRRAGGYDSATVPAEDYDLWLRLLPERQFVKLPDRLYDYRVHTTQSGLVRREEQTARVIEAKLRFLRRQIPGLARPTRLELPCDDRGAELFRKYGPNEGFIPYDALNGAPTKQAQSGDRASAWQGRRAGRAPDVIAVTDFTEIGHYASKLPALGYRQFGNLFAREPLDALDRPAQARGHRGGAEPLPE